MKKILILTAGYGEGHNSAARGVQEGLKRVAPDTIVDLRDIFAETFGAFHQLVRKSYLGLINNWPMAWGYVYRWLDRKQDFEANFARFTKTRQRLSELLDSFRPDVVLSVFPAYPHLLRQLSATHRNYKSVVVVTDSITVNAIWYRAQADYFLLPNNQSAEIVKSFGLPQEKIRVFGFPVSPAFADLADSRPSPSTSRPRVLYMINAGTHAAPEIVRQLLTLDIDLRVTVGRNEKLRHAIESVSAGSKIDIVGWTTEMPRLLCESHVLIGKAGGATVQETIAASCPMIINHVVSGQEEGNARLIVETNSGIVAKSPDDVVIQVQNAFTDNASQWETWHSNISTLSRPRASLEIADFLLTL